MSHSWIFTAEALEVKRLCVEFTGASGHLVTGFSAEKRYWGGRNTVANSLLHGLHQRTALPACLGYNTAEKDNNRITVVDGSLRRLHGRKAFSVRLAAILEYVTLLKNHENTKTNTLKPTNEMRVNDDVPVDFRAKKIFRVSHELFYPSLKRNPTTYIRSKIAFRSPLLFHIRNFEALCRPISRI